MFGKIGIVWVVVSLAVTGVVWGGILEIEVPADLQREDVLNPTAEMGFEATLKNNLTI